MKVCSSDSDQLKWTERQSCCLFFSLGRKSMEAPILHDSILIGLIFWLGGTPHQD